MDFKFEFFTDQAKMTTFLSKQYLLIIDPIDIDLEITKKRFINKPTLPMRKESVNMLYMMIDLSAIYYL